MACKKTTVTNTGSIPISFSYRDCADGQWKYQIPLDVGQEKEIYVLDDTLYLPTLFEENSTIAQIPFPPTPSNTRTPAATPTVTPTSSVTPTETPDPSPTKTPTKTPTPTRTPTPSCVRPSGLSQGYLVFAFGTTTSSTCGLNSYTIYTAADQEEVCGLWDTFNECVCPLFGLSTLSIKDVEYSSIATGQTIYFEHSVSNCEPPIDGYYFFSDTSNYNTKFCTSNPTDTVTAIKVESGIITEVFNCTYVP